MIKKPNFHLLKDDLGRSRLYTRELPREDHSYGLPLYRDKEDAAARNSELSFD